jgi:hypothetical protein
MFNALGRAHKDYLRCISQVDGIDVRWGQTLNITTGSVRLTAGSRTDP